MELKPCPFCGGEYTQVRYIGGEWQEPSAFESGYRGECCSCDAITAAYNTEAEAAAAWNTRHVETCTIGDYKDPDYGYTHDAMWNDEWFMPSGRCSGCGEYIPVWNYCPKCGRKVE